MSAITLTCPHDSRYRIVMDASEIFPDDPGNGTPIMVYGPSSTSATYLCALDTGELEGMFSIPERVYNWLDNRADEVYTWLDNATKELTA